jgi:DNA-binding LacI/PurR family transcriptional regulator
MDKKELRHIYAEKKIRETIRHLNIDDKLPGERTFSKELGISYMTTRRAIDNLVAKGLLYKIPKKGTFVADFRKTAAKTKTKTLGYFLDSSIQDGLSSPYYSMIFDALEKEATKNGYALMYFTNTGGSDFLEIIKKVDGVIISCFPRIEPIIQEMKKHVAVVCIDNCSADKSIPSVTLDNFSSVADSIGYLCTLGHKRIGFITGLDDSDIGRGRLAGYFSALKSRHIAEDMNLVYRGDYSFETGRVGADYFLSMPTPPTAIMCANDAMAISAIKEISRRGLTIPDDMSVIGFDDIVIASQITPALTTVSVPVEEIAKQSIRLLRSVMNDNDLKCQHASLSCQLELRDSSAEINNSSPVAGKLKVS